MFSPVWKQYNCAGVKTSKGHWLDKHAFIHSLRMWKQIGIKLKQSIRQRRHLLVQILVQLGRNSLLSKHASKTKASPFCLKLLSLLRSVGLVHTCNIKKRRERLGQFESDQFWSVLYLCAQCCKNRLLILSTHTLFGRKKTCALLKGLMQFYLSNKVVKIL